MDVRSYDLEALRHQVAMVLQKNVLFSGSIRENLRWGNKDATDAEMEEGYIPAEEESKEAWHTLDMRRRMEFAGTEQIQWIPGGRFAVSYDEDGYAKSAVRLHD